MKTIEDLLEIFSAYSRSKDMDGEYYVQSISDRRFIGGVAENTFKESALSVRQAEVVIKILRKYTNLSDQIFGITYEDFNTLLSAPSYRKQLYKSIPIPRQVKFIGRRKIAFRSNKSDQVKERIKGLKDPYKVISAGFPYYNWTHKVWVVEVTENILEKIYTTIKKLNFTGDEEIVAFFEKCDQAINEKSSAIVEDDCIKLVIQNDEFFAGWLDQNLEVQEDV